jgi:4-amino-4-deoxy-L-arabinose transferase-like glycosyltransferase
MQARITSGLAELEVNPRTQYIALGLITLLAAVLRFYKLGEWSFWIDEIYTMGRAQAHYSSLEAVLRNMPPNRNWVPISTMLTAGALNLLGTSEWSARLVSAVIGVISIPVLYYPVKRLFSPGVGMAAALLLAVSPWHIYWSQNARFYTSLMLLYSLALFAFFVGLERDRPGYLLLSIVLLYLATSERLLALFMVPVVVGYLLLLKVLRFKVPPGLRARNLILLMLPVLAAGIIEVYSLVTNGTSRFLGDFAWFLLYRTDDPFRMLSFIAFSIGIPLMCLALFGGSYLLAQKNRAGLLTFTAAVVPVAFLLLLNPFIFTKDRYVFGTLYFWVVMAAVAVREMLARIGDRGKILAVGVLALLVADAAGNGLLYYHVNNGNRRDWAGAFALIKARSMEGDRVVAYWPELGNYYLGREVIFWEDIDPKAVMQSGERFWFVVDSETEWGNKEMKLWVERKAELVDVRYLRTPDDFALRIYLYEPERNHAGRPVPSRDLGAGPGLGSAWDPSSVQGIQLAACSVTGWLETARSHERC